MPCNHRPMGMQHVSPGFSPPVKWRNVCKTHPKANINYFGNSIQNLESFFMFSTLTFPKFSTLEFRWFFFIFFNTIAYVDICVYLDTIFKLLLYVSIWIQFSNHFYMCQFGYNFQTTSICVYLDINFQTTSSPKQIQYLQRWYAYFQNY